ncbi:MAG: alanine racemase [Atribacterota bacterium]|nr:alanine racemase [Atribacterota bacterium]
MEINVQNLRHNWETLRKIATPHSQIMTEVKATCYGHGVEVAELLSSFGLRDFGVSSVEEGYELKKRGIMGNIYILGGFLPWEAEAIVEEGFIPVVSSLRDVECLEEASKKRKKRVVFHLKVDTGMGRLGFLLKDFDTRVLEMVTRNSFLYMDGIMTHFGSAESDTEYTRWQFELFAQFLNSFGSARKNLICHCCNSAGFLRFPEMRLDMSRIGIALLGVSPNLEATFVIEKGLRPVAQLKAMVKYVKNLPPGFRVGYGGTFVTSRDTRIAVVSIGYAQGIFRNLSNRMEVLVRKKRARVVGSISMDQLMIDVTDIPEVQESDPVTLIGRDGEEEIRVEDLARLAGTIPHEILCSLKKVKARVLTNGDYSSPHLQ